MKKEKLIKLIKDGYSVTPLDDKKPVLLGWQNLHLLDHDIERITSDGYVVNTTADNKTYTKQINAWGLKTGYNNVEVIDIDLKVFSSLQEQTEWFNEFMSFCIDNIEDFKDKFVIQKTQNKGYHIIYKCSEIQGNTKIAKLKGHTEALIETRGKGGQIKLYDNLLNDKVYSDIQEISTEDRFILWSICKTYDYKEEFKEPEYIKSVKEYTGNSITPWDDYNQKTSIFDVVGDEFKIVRQLKDKYIIKRHGATSPHSGYIYNDSGCMYLFSTGTNYPAEKLINPFTAYTIKYHNGDFKESTKELYKLGFGTRSENIIKEKAKQVTDSIEPIEIKAADLIFPIDIFPKPIQSYISDCHNTLNNSIDYMGCSLLWVISTCIGNSMQVEVKKGWRETANIWISLVGKAGIGKTPSINSMLFPLKKINNKEVQNYHKEHEKYEYFNNLTPKEKKEHEEVHKPIKKQFIANDITLEALIDLHQESDNAVAVFKDELAGWVKDMNKYRSGSDLEFWLSSWSGESVNVNRVTRGVSYINRPFIPVLGGIQPSIFSSLQTEENKDNGFMDRLLLTYPELKVDNYSDKELDITALNWYSDAITLFYETINKTNKVIKRDADNNIQPLIYTFDAEAKKEWIRIFNNITSTQNSEEENEYMKSMLPKQKTYIPRFALMLHVFNSFIDSENGTSLIIGKESILQAERLSNYFINMAKKIKINSNEVVQLKKISKDSKLNTNFDKFKAMYEANPKLNKKEVAEILGVSRQQIYKYIKELEKNTKK